MPAVPASPSQLLGNNALAAFLNQTCVFCLGLLLLDRLLDLRGFYWLFVKSHKPNLVLFYLVSHLVVLQHNCDEDILQRAISNRNVCHT